MPAEGFYRMEYQPGMDIEGKIREFEQKMGIPHEGGVSINYQRQGENFGKIIPLILMGLVGFVIFSSMRKSTRYYDFE